MIDDSRKEIALKREHVENHELWGIDFNDVHVYTEQSGNECIYAVEIGFSGLTKSHYRAIPDTKQPYGFKIEEITLLGELGHFLKDLISH